MGVFGEYDVRIDPWDVEYGPEFPANVTDEHDNEEVVLDIEVSADAWRPISPQVSVQFETLNFVDGVRRIDARLLVRNGKQLIHGAFGSAAVGSASITGAGARCTSTVIDRVVALGSGALLLQVNERAGQLDQAFVEGIVRSSSTPKPEFLQNIVSLVIQAFVEAVEIAQIMRVEIVSPKRVDARADPVAFPTHGRIE